MDSSVGHVRLALVVPKFGFTAVRRNKLKRRLRELTRQRVLPQTASCDLLVRAQRSAYDATYDGLRDAIDSVASQLR